MNERDRLLAAIAAEPEAIANWLVYADWLSEREDELGELINLELAIEGGVATPEAIARHGDLARDDTRFLSARLAAQAHHLQLTSWRGFIRRAVVFGPPDDPPEPETLAALYADPHACVLETLDLSQTEALHETFHTLRCEAVRALVLAGSVVVEPALAAGFPSLRELFLSSPQIERLAHPRLERLHGTCPALETGDFDLPNLQVFSLDANPLFELRPLLADFDLPNLEAFSPVPLFQPRALLADPPPRLSTLNCTTWTADGVRALRSSRVLAQLRSLTINIDEAIVDELVREPSPFRDLELVGHGMADTVAECDALRARIASVLPSARIELDALETHAAEYLANQVPPPLDRETADGIGDAMARFAARLRR